MQIELTKGKVYGIKNPKDEIIVGVYLRKIDGEHFFANSMYSENPLYIILKDSHTVFKNEVIIPIEDSSPSITFVPRDKIHKMKDERSQSRLIKILNGAKN